MNLITDREMEIVATEKEGPYRVRVITRFDIKLTVNGHIMEFHDCLIAYDGTANEVRDLDTNKIKEIKEKVIEAEDQVISWYEELERKLRTLVKELDIGDIRVVSEDC